MISAILSLLCLGLLPVNGQIDYNNCVTNSAWHHDTNACYGSTVGVGGCSSSDTADCPTGFTQLKCCATTDTCASVTECQKLPADFGVDTYCPPGKVVMSNCGSGSNADCHVGESEHAGSITCCTVSTISPGSNCQWNYLGFGEYYECATNYALTGWCNSGGNVDCNQDTDSHGLYCCELA